MIADVVWQRMRSLVLEHGDHRASVARAVGLSHLRGKALGLIADEPRTVSELATALVVDKPYTSVMVKDLIDAGLVESTPNPQDRRSKVLTATPAGVSLAARRSELLEQAPPALLALPEADLAALDRILGRIHEATKSVSGGV